MIKKRFSLIPLHLFRSITDVKSDFLEKQGIRFLMLDLDNTIAAYNEHVLSEEVTNWIAEIRNSGIELFIISNSTRKKRVESHSDSIGAGFIMQSSKPSPKSLHDAMELKGYPPEASALAGDQIFTDALAANRAGIASIIVRPKRFTNPFLALRYYIEVPIRAMCKNKY
ncbi:MAG: YqeG family HAD IIIA-type phosphatase [Oscillospiraceae bacterium]|nr:YqeG family HAD IIIA-type phosphatase [Oscillospiraceae bacterium]